MHLFSSVKSDNVMLIVAIIGFETVHELTFPVIGEIDVSLGKR